MAAAPRFYVEYPVCEELKPSVDCLWSSAEAPLPAGLSYPILPDGCVDIVFRFRTRPRAPDPLGPQVSLEDVWIVGPMTRAVWMAQDPTIAWMGARFKPGRAYPFLETPLGVMADLKPDARQLLESRKVKALGRAGEPHSIEERLRIVEATLLGMNGGGRNIPDHVVEGVHRIRAGGGELRIDDLCSELGISRQHLGREFVRYVGLSPKALSRILRFRRVNRSLRGSTPPNWADLAVELGYYDQAHLIAEFSRFSGISPQRYRRLVKSQESR
ncbi:MAG: AraC family transcriptional regulator [Acidobacteria bacterium]|nr:MAG: AraC family transcriptional regulator [Acidobacteriota bacterium]